MINEQNLIVHTYSYASISDTDVLGNVAKQVGEWESIASRKIVQLSKIPHQKVEMQLLKLSEKISRSIFSSLGRRDVTNSFIVCYDQSQRIQAIAITKMKNARLRFNVDKNELCTEITFVATHPHNIRSSVNENEEHRIQGACRAIIDHIKNQIVEPYKGIYLEAEESVVFIYKKLGFSCAPHQNFSEGCVQPMALLI